MRYDITEKKVKNGECKVFNNWNKFTGITEDEFLKGIKWLCEDPMIDLENGATRATRELACEEDGTLTRVSRQHDKNGNFLWFYVNGIIYHGFTPMINVKENI